MECKFKVGDKVKRIRFCHAKMETGDIGTICEVKNYREVKIKEYGADEGWIHDPQYLELVESAATERKFKVGDKVKVVKRVRREGANVDTEGTIILVEPMTYEGELVYRLEDAIGNRKWQEEESIQLITEIKQTVMASKFKVGDQIKFNVREGADSVPTYEYEGLPSIKHGKTIFLENKGTIVDVSGKYYIVRYIDSEYKEVQLGFEADVLTLLPRKDELVGYLVGYRLIKEDYREAAIKIALKEKKDFSNDTPYHFTHVSRAKERLEEAGVLDLWFEPVYQRKESIAITDSQGREAKAVSGKLIVADGEITLIELLKLVSITTSVFLGPKTWAVTLKSATFDIGCWKDVTLDDIKNAIKAIESL